MSDRENGLALSVPSRGLPARGITTTGGRGEGGQSGYATEWIESETRFFHGNFRGSFGTFPQSRSTLISPIRVCFLLQGEGNELYVTRKNVKLILQSENNFLDKIISHIIMAKYL